MLSLITKAKAEKLARRRKGRLVHLKRFYGDTPTTWACERSHEFPLEPGQVKTGTWCSVCKQIEAQEKAEILTREAKGIAEARGGRLNSASVLGHTIPSEWQCHLNHTWKSPLSSVRKGAWCPDCTGFIGERLTRVYFECLFKLKFPTIRPQWLKNPVTNTALEIDGYNEELRIGFEHQGIQHYVHKPHFFKKYREFLKRVELDTLKKKLCKKAGVKVIYVPSVPDILPLAKLPYFLEKELKRKKIKFNFKKNWHEEVDLRRAFAPNNDELIRELNLLAAKKGGKCRSKIFLGTTRKHEWECAKGHIWENTPVKIGYGRWCFECSGIKKKTLQHFEAIVQARGGKLLSKRYRSGKHKLVVECKAGHVWRPFPSNLEKGTWCEDCKRDERNALRRDRTLKKAMAIASKKEGECLSNEYEFQGQPLLFRCKSGHEWKVPPSSIIAGAWCSICSIVSRGLKLRRPFEEILEAVRQRGGKCLSDPSEYNGSDSVLLWECGIGHTWKTTVGSVVSAGNWCGKCAAVDRGKRRREKRNLDYLKSLAAKHGGQCLSADYITANSQYIWLCHCGWKWETSAASVEGGSWCAQCAKKTMGAYKKLSLQDLQRVAKKNGGVCLAGVYLGSTVNHQWRCAKGHEWEAVPASIISGRWCGVCAGNKRKTIEDMHSIAASKSGKCISIEYKNAKAKLTWECSKGHRWEATYDSIQRGSWCGKCAGKG